MCYSRATPIRMPVLPHQRARHCRHHLDKGSGSGNLQVIMTIRSLISLLHLGNPIAG
jgi:hypothetical protein